MPRSGGRSTHWSKPSASIAATRAADGKAPAPSRALLAVGASLLALAALAAASSQQGAWGDTASPVRGVAQIVDGDSLAVAGQTYDLAGVDAPELAQRCTRQERLYDCGLLAQAALMDLTAGVQVECRRLAQQPASDGVPLARCTAGGYDLSEGMVYTGWALIPPDGGSADRYQTAFGPIQQGARERRRGLWKGAFVEPWAWRQGRRLPGEPLAGESGQ
ncbi:MAG TPA: thermonuclease family protein [Kiloniellaceae bacterium]|nr:thermonuclease family protein [Kiloniellaceae bacterium]